MKISAPGLSLASAAPTNSAEADVAAVGTGALAARDDHKHGREAFAAPAVVLGTVAAAGVATTPMRTDATIVAFDATAPTTIAAADVAAAGVAAVAARRDHRHGNIGTWTKVAAGQLGAVASLNLSGLSGYRKYQLVFVGRYPSSSQAAAWTLKLNGGAAHYACRNSTLAAVNTAAQDSAAAVATLITSVANGGLNAGIANINVSVTHDDQASSGTSFTAQAGFAANSAGAFGQVTSGGAETTGVNSISAIRLDFPTLTGGEYVLYGSNDIA